MISSSAAANNRLNSYTYDAAGNVTYDGTHHYTYDAAGRVLEVDGGSTASYVYNENGQRVRKNTGSTWTEYFYGPSGQVQSEYNGSWPVQYVYVGSRLIAGYAQGTTAFDFTDQLGSTRLIIAVNQSIVDNMDYEPFGQQTAGGSAATHKFTGKQRDGEDGLDYFPARYFTSTAGRWMSPDIVGGDQSNPQSLNRYAYVLNNPSGLIDSLGFEDSGDSAQVNTGTCGPAPCGPIVPPPVVPLGPLPNLPMQSGASAASALGGAQPSSFFAGSFSQGGAFQMGLNFAGMVPGLVGMAANLGSAAISFHNGYYGAAALSLAFALPVIGQFGAEADEALDASEIGYSSFRAFKRSLWSCR